MQYFNESNSEVEYIKDILRTTYIPTVRVFNSETNIQPTPKNSSININTSYEPLDLEEYNSQIFKGETIIYDDNIEVGTPIPDPKDPEIENSPILASERKYINKYRFGEWYPNISTNYISSRNYYDSNLHEALGRYLRFYRDYYKIDVLNFYNCFSNRFFSTFSLPLVGNGSGLITSLTEPKKGYKVTAFPILFDTTYKIKIYGDIQDQIELQAIYFNGNIPLELVEDDTVYKSTTSEFEITIGSKISFTNSEAQSRKVRSNQVLGDSKALKNKLNKQSLLYLFMQYSEDIEAPIVVLEQPKFTNAINNSLLSLNFREEIQVAFSDTLLEYISGNAITPATKIFQNVHKIQQQVYSKEFYDIYGVGGPTYEGVEVPQHYKYTPGLFDKYLQETIYKALSLPVIKYSKLIYNKDKPGIDYSKYYVLDDGSYRLATSEDIGKDLYVQVEEYENASTDLINFIGFVDKNVESILDKLIPFNAKYFKLESSLTEEERNKP